MAYTSTIEDLVDDVLAFVKANLATYVSAVNSAKGDAIALVPVREIELSDQDPYAAGVYPRVQLFVRGLNTEYIASGYDSAMMNFIGVIAISDHSDQRTKLLRYAEAFRQILRDYNTLGASGFDVDPRGMSIEYFPTDPDMGVGVASVSFNVYKDIPN